MKQALFLLAVSLTLSTSCMNGKKKEKSSDESKKMEETEKHATTNNCEDVHWSHHEGENGPENWENLCDGFSKCGGESQSPINISTQEIAAGEDLAKPEFEYGQSPTHIINNGHTVQFNIDGENNVTLNDKNYKLLQFHYHALSEHTIDGEHSPLEVHFVNKHSDNDYAVIGAMYVEGEENELLKKYLDKFPEKDGEYNSEDFIDLMKILPENKSYYYYSGSLTTPPCSEVVSWYILKNPIEASQEQIEKFSEILDNNYRPVQPLNQRTVKLYQE